MRINVRVKPKSRFERVEKTDSGFLVYVREPPVDNKANKAAVTVLSEYFDISKSKIRIVLGHKSRQKVIEIIE